MAATAEKHPAAADVDAIGIQYSTNDAPLDKAEFLEAREVFQKDVDGVEFRTVSWQRAAVIFCKIQFAMSILSVPSALATLGAVGGALSIVGWGALNTCTSMMAA